MMSGELSQDFIKYGMYMTGDFTGGLCNFGQNANPPNWLLILFLVVIGLTLSI